MDLVFLGTASAQPSPTRSHSCIALRWLDALAGETWLFDCGEGSQHQLIRAPTVPSLKSATNGPPRLSRISKIFITHLHGDHAFGLPGLLCTLSQCIGQSQQLCDETRPPLEIYGPKGLRRYLASALSATYSRLGCLYVVHELHFDKDSDPEDHRTSMQHPEEKPGSDLKLVDLANGARGWMVFQLVQVTVTAAPIVHTVPTVGYVITESPSAGRLKVEEVTPILKRNATALGLKNPLSLLSKLKSGETLAMPDGAILSPSEFLEPERPGRCVVILGDTSDPSSVERLVGLNGCDVLVHEATNACLAEDIASGATETDVEEKTKAHGHSTPQMAGAFGKRIDDEESLAIMDNIRQLAVGTFGSDNVVAVRDFSRVEVPRVNDRSPIK